MTEPTDDELDAVIAEYRTRIYPQDMHPRFERAIMRAAIAKWGTPPAVAGESGEIAQQLEYLLLETENKQHPHMGAVAFLEACEAFILDHGADVLNLLSCGPTQTQAGAVPLTPWMKPGQFFGGRPERAMEIDTTDFYGITEAIHHALEMLENHSAAGTDSSPLDPKRSRRLRQALMAAWLLEYPDEAVHHGIKGGQHGTE